MFSLPTSIKGRVAAGLLSLSVAGAGAIVAHEGMRKVAYVDPVGIVTVCAGHTQTAKLGQVKTEDECAALLKQDVKHAEQAIRRLVTVPVTQTQFDALVSLTFNIGQTNFAHSTLLRKINAGDCWGAGQEFSRWIRADGRILPGLVKRRADERTLWETGCANKSTGATQKSVRGFLPSEAWAQARRPEPLSLTALAFPA